MQSTVKQNKLQLAFGVHHAPKDAPAKLLRQIECQMRRGVRSIPAALEPGGEVGRLAAMLRAA